MEDVETKEQRLVWGEHPNVYIILTSEGRWVVVEIVGDRKPTQTDEDRATAFGLMLAHSGRYRTEGNKIVVKVEIPWPESWKSTEQVRYYSRLHLEAAPQSYAGRVMRGILIWTRDT